MVHEDNENTIILNRQKNITWDSRTVGTVVFYTPPPSKYYLYI